MFRISSLAFLLVSFINVSAQIPTGYYNTATGSGYTLKTNLHNIIDDHTSQSYSNVWNFVETNDLDTYYENDNTLLDIYSENPAGIDPYNFTAGNTRCGNQSSEGDCYNREHSFPASWFSDGAPMFTDIHHLFPTDGRVNNFRSNLPFGEVSTPNFTSDNGSLRGSSGISGYSGSVFEPIDEFKGDLARTYFYMATRYQDIISGWSSPMLNGSTDQVYTDWALEMLIDWHLNDPVSQKEIDRNNNAYTFQANRNPFVDHPEYVNSIWGDCSNPTSAPSALMTSAITGESANLSFTGGDGDSRIVIIKEASAVDFDPIDGIGYQSGASADFSVATDLGSGNKVVSVSGTTAITITGLNSLTTYYVEVFELCSDGNLYYTSSSLTGNFTTTEPAPLPDNYGYAYISFNEIVISTPGNPDYEIIELVGIPGQDLTGLSIIVLDQNGVVINDIDLNGEVISPSGFWLAANVTAAASVSEDFSLTDELENNTSTYFLVTDFSGSNGDDLDTNNDGVLNTTPWSNIISELAFIEAVGEEVYTTATIGPDGTFMPPGAFRNSDQCGAWTLHTFDTPPDDVTPGTTNGTSCFTAYNGSSWTAGVPDGTKQAVVNGALSSSITAETLLIVKDGTITLGAGEFMNVSGGLTNNGAVTIESGASLVTGNDITGTGSFTIERNTTFNSSTGQYSFVSSPIETGETSSLGTVVYRYDETIPYSPSGSEGAARYVSAGSTDMVVGNGYASAYTGQISFTGVPNNGDISVDLSKTNHSVSDAAEDDFEGYNLIGNPYPSAIKLTDFFAENNTEIEGAVWIWDDNNTPGVKGSNSDFITINSMGAVSGGTRSSDWNGYLGAMQGFFVQVKKTNSAGTYSADFKNNMRYTTNNGDGSFFRTSHTGSKLRLSINDADGNQYDELLIGFMPDATLGRESEYDASKISVNQNEIYSLIDSEKFAIQGLPAYESSTVTGIGFSIADLTKTYQIALTEMVNLEEFVFIKDYQTGNLWNLRNGAYTFTSDNNSNKERFSLIVAKSFEEISEMESQIDWNIDKEGLTVFGLENLNAEVTIIGMNGQILGKSLAEKIGDQHQFSVDFKSNTLYILQISDGNQIKTVKAIIR